MEAKESSNLDLVRAVAVLCVFAAHFRDLITGTGAHISWAIGQMGVLIFFVHTSLVLMMSLERSARKLKGRILVADFYVRRFFRIYPLSIVVVTVAFLELVPTRLDPWPWSTYISNLALTLNLTYSEHMWWGLWTLPLEVQMYVALPFLFLWLRERAFGWALAMWAVAVAVGVLQPYVSQRLSIGQYGPCFVAGVVAWRLMHTVRARYRGALWPLVFGATTSIWLIAPRHDATFYRWAFCLALGCAIPWFRELRWTPLVVVAGVIAKYSYGIYLSHAAIIRFALTLDGLERWVTLIALVVSVPVAMFHLIEQPMIALGRRLARQATQSAVVRDPSSVSILHKSWSLSQVVRTIFQRVWLLIPMILSTSEVELTLEAVAVL